MITTPAKRRNHLHLKNNDYFIIFKFKDVQLLQDTITSHAKSCSEHNLKIFNAITKNNNKVSKNSSISQVRNKNCKIK